MKLIALVESILVDSDASEEAKKKGLSYAGWGKWTNREGEVVAQTVNGKLQFTGRQKYIQPVDEKVRKAEEFATYAHGEQQYGTKPYTYHLNKVFQNVVRFGGTSDQRAIAWLHDVLEDTAVSRSELEAEFGTHVAFMVDLLSNTMGKKLTYERIRSHSDAVFVKLCDRLANAQEGQKNEKYKKDYPLFKSILYRQGEFDSLWHELDKILGE